MKSRFYLAAIALSFSLGLPAHAAAQGGYFGRNKVQYRDFDFQVLKTPHFDIYYYPEEEKARAGGRADGRALVHPPLARCSSTT